MSDSPDNNGPPGVNTTVTPPVSDPRWQAAVQIASSACFRRSPRLKELWLYIARNSLLGRDDQLTESEIARQVFGRGVDYIQTDDSIVRSSARQLRWKLKEALEKENTAWSVEIPKGRYVAQFQLREQEHPEAVPARPVSKNFRPWVLTGTLGAFLALSIAVNLWFMLRPASETRSKERLGLVASLVLDHAGQTSVVLDDYAYVLMAPRPLLPGEELLSNYITHAYVPNAAAPSQDPALLKLWNCSEAVISFHWVRRRPRIESSGPCRRVSKTGSCYVMREML